MSFMPQRLNCTIKMKRQQFSKSCLGLIPSLYATGFSCAVAAEAETSTKAVPEFKLRLRVMVSKWVAQDGQVFYKTNDGKVARALMGAGLCGLPSGMALQKPAVIFGADCRTFDDLLMLDSLSTNLTVDGGFDPRTHIGTTNRHRPQGPGRRRIAIARPVRGDKPGDFGIRLVTQHTTRNTINVPEAASWIADSSRFYYRKSIKGGHQFVVMDAATQQRRPAFRLPPAGGSGGWP